MKNIDLHTTHQNVIFIDFYTFYFYLSLIHIVEVSDNVYVMKYKKNPSVEFDELEPRQSWLTHWLPFLRSILSFDWLIV